MRSLKRRVFCTEWVQILISIISFLAIWQVIVVALKVPNHLVPSPLQIFLKFLTDWPLLIRDIRVTSVEMLLGFGICVLLTVPFSVLVVWSPVLEQALMPLLIFTQTIPLIAVIPILIVWFGMGILPKVIVVFLLCFFNLLLLTISGLKSVEPEMIDLMRSMSASTSDVFLKVKLPASLPFIFDGMKLAALLSVIGAVVAEIVGADYGLGHAIIYAINDLHTDLLFVVIFILTAMGAVLYYFIEFLERIVLFWHVAVRKKELIHDVG